VVRGQAIFQEWFKDFENQYVLIGGTAASITMEEAGVPFRGTKDLDIGGCPEFCVNGASVNWLASFPQTGW